MRIYWSDMAWFEESDVSDLKGAVTFLQQIFERHYAMHVALHRIEQGYVTSFFRDRGLAPKYHEMMIWLQVLSDTEGANLPAAFELVYYASSHDWGYASASHATMVFHQTLRKINDELKIFDDWTRPSQNDGMEEVINFSKYQGISVPKKCQRICHELRDEAGDLGHFFAEVPKANQVYIYHPAAVDADERLADRVCETPAN